MVQMLAWLSAAAALNHANICTIHEIATSHGEPFIVMERLRGRTLKARLDQGPLATDEAIDAGIQIADALAAAHATGIAHRDIKPANLFLCDDGRVKVLDFGLAKQVEPKGASTGADPTITGAALYTQAGTTLGTIAYMSPEQALGQELDGRTDIFSLGVVLYEMVTGVLPFQGHNSTSIVDAILHKDPVPPVRLNQEVPSALEQVIGRALEKDRQLRYQSASDLRAELSRIKRDSSLEAVRSTSGSGAAAAAAQLDSSARDRSSRPAATKRLRGTLVAGVLAIVAIIGIFGWRFGRTEALAESDFILLTDFVNTTGDQVFDGALKQALAIALEESPFLNVVPESRVSATLRQMQRPPDERLTPALGREVCQRQQVKAMLTGEIAPVGSHFAITLNALNCGTGDSIARQQVEAESKERVLTAMGEAASAIRRRLGESLKSIEGTATPIPEATTASLEALKAFSTGDFTRARGRPMDAVPFYKHAIELDPNFALAYARLATVYRNTFEREVSEPYFRKAFEMRDRVSERERLYITAQYYLNIEQDFAKATETYQLWSEMYPRDSVPRNNLGVLFSRTGQKENALKAFQESLRVAPDLELTYGNVMGTLRQLGRYDESRKTLQDIKARFGETTNYHLGMFELAYVSGDAAGMQRHSSAIRATASQNGLVLGEAQIAAVRGRLAEARRMITTSATTLQRQGFKEIAGTYLGVAGAWEALAGQCAEAQALSSAAIASSRGLVPMVTRAAALAECGKTREAEAILSELETQGLTRPYPEALAAGSSRAMIALQQGDAASAVSITEGNAAYEDVEGPGLTAIYVRGRAHLAAGDPARAAAAFQKCATTPAGDVASPHAPIAWSAWRAHGLRPAMRTAVARRTTSS